VQILDVLANYLHRDAADVDPSISSHSFAPQ
jgi:hypothetical protein